MPQFARPSSDVITSGWSPSTPGSHYVLIDEVTPSDLDYTRSANTASETQLIVGLSAVTDPAQSSGHVVRVRVSCDSTQDVYCNLLQGGTVIATLNITAGFSPTTFSLTLTGTQADAITNYAALRLQFVKPADAFANRLFVYWAELEVPSAVQNVDLSAIVSAEAFGSPSVELTSYPAGIATAEAFGSPVSELALAPAGIASAEALGSPSAGLVYDVDGIGSGEAFGSVTAGPGVAYVDPAGIATAEAFGAPDFVGNRSIDADAIAGTEAVGSVRVELLVDPAGIVTAEAFGAPTAALVPVLRPIGIATAETFGRPLLRGGQEQFLGVMDDVRIFSGTLPSDGEIEDAALRELTGNEAGLVYYDKFDTGTGTTSFPNVGGSGLNGTLSGAVRWVGFEGGADVRGQRKPRIWGVKRQVSGVWIDHQRPTMQVNNGPTHQIVPFDRALSSLVYDGDFSNIYDWVSVSGHYATQLSKGKIRFHEKPLGKPSFDVWGDKTGGAYVEAPVDVMLRLATEEGGINLLTGVNLEAVFDAGALRQDAIGLATENSPMTLSQALDLIANTIDARWFFERGLFSLWLRQDPKTEPDWELDENNVVAEAIRRTPGRQVTKAWKIAFQRFAVTHELHEIAGSVPESEKPKFTQEWRSVRTPVDDVVSRRHRDSRIGEASTLYDQEAAAWAEAFRRQALDKKRRDLYDVPLRDGVWKFRIGETVRLKLNRFKFPAEGRLFVIGGYDEDASTGAVTLFLWG